MGSGPGCLASTAWQGHKGRWGLRGTRCSGCGMRFLPGLPHPAPTSLAQPPRRGALSLPTSGLSRAPWCWLDRGLPLAHSVTVQCRVSSYSSRVVRSRFPVNSPASCSGGAAYLALRTPVLAFPLVLLGFLSAFLLWLPLLVPEHLRFHCRGESSRGPFPGSAVSELLLPLSPPDSHVPPAFAHVCAGFTAVTFSGKTCF